MQHSLRVHLLGGLEIEGVPAMAVGSRKARAVLRRLAMARGAAVSVDELVDVAWPEGAPARGPEQLSVLTSRLRSTVGTERLIRSDAGYALLPDWLDLVEVETATAACADALARGDAAHAHDLGRTALDLVRGPLLPEDVDALWLEGERTAVGRTVTRLRLLTSEAALASGAAWDAAELAQRCLDDDPYDEAALRLLLRGLAGTGRVAAALTTYLASAEVLREELGTDPSPETEAVYLALLRADVPRTAAVEPATQDLPGRHEELAALARSLDRAAAGSPSLVVLEGPAGIGKTTVLERFAAQALAGGAVVLHAAGDRVGGALPLQPVLDALAVALRRLPVADLAAALAPDAELLGPLLRLTASALPTTAAYATLASGAGRALLVAALEGVLLRLGGGAPVVLLVDDGHQVDQATAELLHHCTRAAAPAKLLVVVARRAAGGPTWRGRLHLELEPLDRSAVSQVVGESRADELWSRSGGLPLFLVELARYDGSELPESVLAAVAERCAGTGDVAATLRAAAVLGAEVEVGLLAEILELAVPTALDHIEEGLREQLLVESGHGFAFSHQMFREALAAGVSSGRRTLLHRAAARVLSGRPQVDPLRVAHHALGGDDPILAAEALSRAAQIAAERYENGEAVTLLGQAIELEDTVSRKLERARAHLLVGQYDEANDDATDAIARGAGAAGLEAAALIAYYRRDLDEALALADQAAASSSDPELAAGCLALAGRILLALGRMTEADARLAEAQDLATGPTRALAAVWRSLTKVMQGDAAGAYRLARGPEAAAAHGQPLLEPHRAIAVGRSLAMLGRAADAVAAFDRLAQTVERQHVVRFAGRADNYRGWVLRNLGAYAEADDATQQAWEAVGRLDDIAAAEARGHAVLDLADSRLRAGDLDGAHRWLDEATRARLAPHVMKWRFELRRDLSLGRLALAVGDVGAAAQHADAVRTHADELTVPRFQVQARLLAARAAHADGQPVDLDEVAALAAQLATVAPLESWWIAAELAHEFGVDAWRRLAADRVTALASDAGPWADDLRRAAAATLD
jgi:DNA-binding SARP family transcriptional activator